MLIKALVTAQDLTGSEEDIQIVRLEGAAGRLEIYSLWIPSFLK